VTADRWEILLHWGFTTSEVGGGGKDPCPPAARKSLYVTADVLPLLLQMKSSFNSSLDCLPSPMSSKTRGLTSGGRPACEVLEFWDPGCAEGVYIQCQGSRGRPGGGWSAAGGVAAPWLGPIGAGECCSLCSCSREVGAICQGWCCLLGECCLWGECCLFEGMLSVLFL